MITSRVHRSPVGHVIIAGLFFFVLIPAFALIATHPAIADEVVHSDQIQRFARGDMTLHPLITQLPVYHLIVAIPSALTGFRSLAALRLFSFLLAACSVPAFFIVARRLDPAGAVVRTLQFGLLPLLFPLFFLIYTDVPSLVPVFLALYAVLRRQPSVAAVCVAVSILMRQNNIVWAMFLWVFLLLSGGYFHGIRLFMERHAELSTLSLRWVSAQGALLRWIADTRAFLHLFVLFAVFLLFNGGVAVGDVSAHPFPSFHWGNVYFFLFLFFFLFLPLHVANLPRLAQLLRGRWVPALSLILLFALLFLITFVNDHPDNQAEYSFFLRNRLLLLFTSGMAWKALFFLPVLASVLSLLVTRLVLPASYLLYPVSFLFLTSSWLIEQRYYLVPLAFFLLFREHRSRTVEWTIIACWAAGSAILFMGINQGRYFL
ncbi:MAG: hypothetical protein PHZ00_02470 [Candidatus Peribacteraceae bacterium]|nr:hypothetical protein [Candidatus Peribacteraceae bacterium]